MSDPQDLIPPGEWVLDDFKRGDRIIVRGQGTGTVISKTDLGHDLKPWSLGMEVKLYVNFDGRTEVVFPNQQWLAWEPIAAEGTDDE